MVLVDHRVAQLIVLVAVFQHGLLELRAFGQTEALGQRTGGDIAHNDFQRHDVNLLHQRLAVGNFFNVMRRDAVFLQHLHQEIRHAVVDDALAHNRALLEAVERGCVVLVVHQHNVRIVRRKNLLRLAFIELFELLHCCFLLLYHGCLPQQLMLADLECSCFVLFNN